MSPLPDDTLEDQIRDALAWRGSLYEPATIVPVPGVGPSTSRRRTSHRVLVAAGACALIVAMVIAVVLVRTDDSGHVSRTVHPSEKPLFPDVVRHKGPELLLAPTTIPAGYDLLLATGPDAGFRGSSGGGCCGATFFEQWVKLDAARTRPLTGFALGWGPMDVSKELPTGFSLPSAGDALAGYRNQGTPITIAGHPAYMLFGGVAWQDGDQIVTVEPYSDNPMGTWPESLDQTQVETIAAHVARNRDGTYRLAQVPPGFEPAGRTKNFARSGINQRKLVYSNNAHQGFSVQLTDNTQVPPGIALSWPGAELVKIRNQQAVLTHFLNGGDGSGCSAIDGFLCGSPQIGVNDTTYAQWLEPDSTRVTISAVGLTDQQVLDIARGLTPISPTKWKTLTDRTDKIPCALTARCDPK